MIYTELFEAPSWDRREIMRYGRIGESEEMLSIMEECIREAQPVLSYRVCYVRTVIERGESLRLSVIETGSQTLCKALRDCDEAIIFAATAGAGIDRLISRYGRISPAKALVFQAIGAERIESLCDAFCVKMSDELRADKKTLKTRVSPGYGDIPLAMQRDIFALLDCPRKIGLTLNDSLMMSPGKSVTAIAGITPGCREYKKSSCADCTAKECPYRGSYGTQRISKT